MVEEGNDSIIKGKVEDKMEEEAKCVNAGRAAQPEAHGDDHEMIIQNLCEEIEGLKSALKEKNMSMIKLGEEITKREDLISQDNKRFAAVVEENQELKKSLRAETMEKDQIQIQLRTSLDDNQQKDMRNENLKESLREMKSDSEKRDIRNNELEAKFKKSYKDQAFLCVIILYLLIHILFFAPTQKNCQCQVSATTHIIQTDESCHVFISHHYSFIHIESEPTKSEKILLLGPKRTENKKI
ncbi:uncharacterized protein C713.09-like [Anneissia japonica]|uniref:uncharacterized protein C713.09-like n=1 Tax=Anneissia japonica TaxID=1529436 RepID=UPI0014258198|nr:uncharacterized protein C713.09-like [Anneissia japonica]